MVKFLSSCITGGIFRWAHFYGVNCMCIPRKGPIYGNARYRNVMRIAFVSSVSAFCSSGCHRFEKYCHWIWSSVFASPYIKYCQQLGSHDVETPHVLSLRLLIYSTRGIAQIHPLTLSFPPTNSNWRGDEQIATWFTSLCSQSILMSSLRYGLISACLDYSVLYSAMRPTLLTIFCFWNEWKSGRSIKGSKTRVPDSMEQFSSFDANRFLAFCGVLRFYSHFHKCQNLYLILR